MNINILKNLNYKNFALAKRALHSGKKILIIGKYLIITNKNKDLIKRVKHAKNKK